jgi:SAM-dependent methyltransferase
MITRDAGSAVERGTPSSSLGEECAASVVDAARTGVGHRVRRVASNNRPYDEAMMPHERPWQLRVFSRTLKKKQRLTALRRILGCLDGYKCLLVTCGDNNGAINYRLRHLGGHWSWADCDNKSIHEMSELLGEAVSCVDPGQLPYPNEQFDCVVTIDVHEHVEDPETFTSEVRRVLKPGGRAVITVPGGDPRKFVNRLKKMVGMTREKYGHVRDGFSVPELESLMRLSEIEPARVVTFSRFFTELIELGINYAYVQKLSKKSSVPVTVGTIAPLTSAQLRSVEKTYRLYSLIYPFVWVVSRLDWLLFFTHGYVVLVEGRKRAREAATS